MFSYVLEADFDLAIPGVIRQGHGVASGTAASSPYPHGTLAQQIPFFRERGVDLAGFFRGTLNVDISPFHFAVAQPDVTLRQVAWTDRIPPEDFSFCACLLEAHGTTHPALIYHPHPETKVEHFQNASIVEILAPYVKGLGIGAMVTLRFRHSQVRVRES